MVLRGYFGMTLLGDDVLVCGGNDQYYEFLSSCDLYNASINKWAAPATIHPLPVVLYSFAMITLLTRPFVFGGAATSGGVVNTVYTLDTLNTWATRTPMERAVFALAAVALDTNTALVCGGTDGSTNGSVSACSSYAATKNVWSPAAQMITARHGHGMAVYKGLFTADHGFA
jgi:hypothetical protein